jgi:hypothetical protein
MSTYNGRRAPNVSHLLQDLNTVSAHDAATEENFNMEDDLELFTNTQFYDFDSGRQTDFQAQPVKAALNTVAATANTATENVTTAPPSAIGDMPNLDFAMTGKSPKTFWTSFALQSHLSTREVRRLVKPDCLTKHMSRCATSQRHRPSSQPPHFTSLVLQTNPHPNTTTNALPCIAESNALSEQVF